MKHILMSVAILVFLSACSGKNAFSLFDLDEEQELSVASLLSSKLKSKDGKVYGIVSAIYLNDIYPEAYHNNEYFIYFCARFTYISFMASRNQIIHTHRHSIRVKVIRSFLKY